MILLTAGAHAQDEQWLQYHSAREARLVGFGSNYQYPEFITEKPAGTELPQFKSEAPIFAKWLTPMVQSGYLWVALDRTHKQGPYNLLYINSNVNGHLKDETVATAHRTDQYRAYFGPVKVAFSLLFRPALRISQSSLQKCLLKVEWTICPRWVFVGHIYQDRAFNRLLRCTEADF